MFDFLKASTPRTASDSAEPAGPKVGGTTLTQQLALEDHTRRPMFEADPQWEPIDAAEVAEPPLPSPGVTTGNAATTRAAPATVPSAPTADAVPVAGEPADPLHVGNHTNAHAGPFERKLTQGDHHRPALDAFNRGTVHSDHASAHVFGRPGV